MTNQSTSLSLQKIAYFLFIVAGMVYIAIVAQAIIVPIIFAILFAFMLIPMSKRFERWTRSRVLGILLSYLVTALPVVAAIAMFSFQFYSVFVDFSLITESLIEGTNDFLRLVEDEVGVERNAGRKWVMDNAADVLDAPVDIISNSLASTTTVVFNLFLILLYSFFFLLYRSSIYNFFLVQFRPTAREVVSSVLNSVQKVSQQYLYGMAMVIIILGLLNSIGLYCIGIGYAFFWGFLAAFLAIIPYIGSTIGGILPFLYAIATTGTMWQPMAVVVLYGTVQAIEGNLITPNVVGSSVNVNPLAAIFSLIVGGTIWGIGGLILALPMVAILRILFAHIPFLKPVGVLLGSDVYKNAEIFFEEYDRAKYRLGSILLKKMPTPKSKVIKDKVVAKKETKAPVEKIKKK